MVILIIPGGVMSAAYGAIAMKICQCIRERHQVFNLCRVLQKVDYLSILNDFMFSQIFVQRTEKVIVVWRSFNTLKVQDEDVVDKWSLFGGGR